MSRSCEKHGIPPFVRPMYLLTKPGYVLAKFLAAATREAAVPDCKMIIRSHYLCKAVPFDVDVETAEDYRK